ncbi:hypothetical protein GUJ93_ZPchr0003g17932 [Zizania palustris]|uniref:RRM domain-containing protein n=1 Tax=Zizania palustris TaxID=103762 RepID=A0A8J5VET0_ZIZPA|nr:hypothetical protein GUJ93_ZPchr0003g17932 [Zizania palustris]
MNAACARFRSATKMESFDLTQSVTTELYFLNSCRRRGSTSDVECRSHSRLPNNPRRLLEEGPNSFQPSDPVLIMVVDSGLKDDLVFGDPNRSCFVLWEEKLRPVCVMYDPQLLWARRVVHMWGVPTAAFSQQFCVGMMSLCNSCTIYVGNLPGDIREREVDDLFYKLQVELAHGGRGPSFDWSSSYSSVGCHGASRCTDYCVMVTGLPSSTSWQYVKDHIRRAGDVYFSDVYCEVGDDDGTDPGEDEYYVGGSDEDQLEDIFLSVFSTRE